ncbi:MAG: hypothetical protein M3Y87_12320 [Myxococcota bacterium]|nr:hypothetical protein [Myxococcota bacterium]
MTTSHDDRPKGVTRRTFLIATGGALVVTACGDSMLADDAAVPGTDGGAPGSDGGAVPTDAGDGPGADAGVARDWQLAEGHYEGHFPLHVIYPRPDAETESYARHRHAYPGILYEIPIGVQFGKWPYRYELLEGPTGARVVHETLQWNGVDAFVVPEGYGVIAWDAPASAPAGPQTFRVRVYDQDHDRPEPSFVDVEWTTNVGTSQFVFLDTIGGDDASADGTIAAPFKEIAALQDSGLGGNKICYVRQTALFDPDDSLFDGGYVPTPARQFTFGESTFPKAYVAFPGETVHVNTAGQIGFAQSNDPNDDVFFDRIVTAFTDQIAKERANVRVIMNWNRATRSTFWRMGCIRAYGGNRKDDNHGFIWYWNAGGDVAEGTGHSYLYAADCWMDKMNVDLGPEAAFEGVGSNGPHLWETYTVNRALAERLRVTHSHIVNNGFIILKGSARDGEIRACVTVDGNTGNYHVRGLGSGSNGESQRLALCFNKTGGEEGRVAMGQAGANPAYADIIAYRNSCAGGISAASNPEALSHAYNNIARGIAENVHIAEGNVEHAGDVAAVFDAEMNLVGEARATHLGTKGAELA